MRTLLISLSVVWIAALVPYTAEAAAERPKVFILDWVPPNSAPGTILKQMHWTAPESHWVRPQLSEFSIGPFQNYATMQRGDDAELGSVKPIQRGRWHRIRAEYSCFLSLCPDQFATPKYSGITPGADGDPCVP